MKFLQVKREKVKEKREERQDEKSKGDCFGGFDK